MPIREWNTEQVIEWLNQVGYSQYNDLFVKVRSRSLGLVVQQLLTTLFVGTRLTLQNKIDGEVLLTLEVGEIHWRLR